MTSPWSRLEEGLERANQTHDLATESVEGGDRESRLLSIADCYLKGRIGLHLHAAEAAPQKQSASDSQDLCVVLQGTGRLEGECDLGTGVTDYLHECVRVNRVGERDGGEKSLVFVAIGKGGELSDQMRISGLVGLRSLNDCPLFSGLIDPVEWALATLGWVPNPIIKLRLGRHDRKGRVASRSVPLCQNELPDEQVKGGAKVVDQVARDGRKLCRNRLNNGPDDDPLWVSVVIEGNLIRTAFQKRFCELFETVVVLPGPRDFDPATVE
jgi:hypothetical protein